MEKFIELIRRKEGVDLTKKELIVYVKYKEKAIRLLTVLKEHGFRWVNTKEIDPYALEDNELFCFNNENPVVINFVKKNIWVDIPNDMLIDEMIDFFMMSEEQFDNYFNQSKELKEYNLGLLDSPILTIEGEYKLEDLSLAKAVELVDSAIGLDSAIDNGLTADALSTLLGKEIQVNSKLFCQKVGQKAIVFNLKRREEERKTLSKEEIDKIGYRLQLLTRIL